MENESNNAYPAKKQFRIRISTAIAIAVLIIFIVARFEIITYRGQKILMFETTGIPFGWDSQSGVILGKYQLETEYGTLTIKYPCHVFAIDRKLDHIADREFKAKHALHDFEFMGNKLQDAISVVFDRKAADQYIRLMGIEQNIKIAGRECYVYAISVNKTDALLRLNITDQTGDIILSDGSYIVLDQFSYFFTMKNNLWSIELESILRPNKAIKVMHPTQNEYKKYKSITFEENWGAFIEGELYDDAATGNIIAPGH
jgi:hypothetical protein